MTIIKAGDGHNQGRAKCPKKQLIRRMESMNQMCKNEESVYEKTVEYCSDIMCAGRSGVFLDAWRSTVVEDEGRSRDAGGRRRIQSGRRKIHILRGSLPGCFPGGRVLFRRSGSCKKHRVCGI